MWERYGGIKTMGEKISIKTITQVLEE